MTLKKKPTDKREQSYKYACWQGYCPTLAERRNSRIIELANRLKADSKKETLANISEWQNNNIIYWYERYPLSGILLVLIFFSLFNLYLSYILPFWWLWWLVAVLGIASVTLLVVIVILIVDYRKIPLKHFLDIFSFSLSTDFMLENKLAICRDYAKLSSNLLFNIYPETDVYFVHARSHVATGIIVEKKLYILDKYLPVATIDKWHEKWNKAFFSEKGVDRVKGTCLESIDLNSLLSKTSQSKLDTDMLANKLEKLLSIQRTIDESRAGSIRLLYWKKGVILYEDDEIVNYSLAQRLRNKLSNEMFDINRVVSIEINRNKDDLIFQVKVK